MNVSTSPPRAFGPGKGTASPERLRRFGRVAALIVVAAALVVIPLRSALALTSAAADTTATVNLDQPGKAATHAGAGFLYGLTQDGSGPADSVLQPLAPTLFRGGGARIAGGGWIGDTYTAGSGYRVRITSALAQARRVTAAPYHATYHLLVSDLYGADTTQPANTVYPCDNNTCATWKSFVDQVVADVKASGATTTRGSTGSSGRPRPTGPCRRC